jgi:hypothetical protein
MWLLQWLPDWIFYAVLLAGIVGAVASKFIPTYYRSIVQVASAIAVIAGLFMTGAIHEKDRWEARVKEMEAKLAAAEAESAKENIKIVEKVITRRNVIKQRGEDVIKYIDREVTKYDTQCVIPKEFIQAHNKAAEQVK